MDSYIIGLQTNQTNQTMNDTYTDIYNDNEPTLTPTLTPTPTPTTDIDVDQSFKNMIFTTVSLIVLGLSCLTACFRYCDNKPIIKRNQLGERILFTDTLSSDECSICLDKFKKDDKIIKLNCNHTYHFQCISQWFKQDITCPICRQSPL
tara:strand:+ start:798 stop:1244 length:447 start_codon:yes stop_codon:yes gene_type:complete